MCFIYYTGDNCTDNSIQLVDGDGYSSGRLEVCYEGTWGTVCSMGFGLTAGDVVCKQLGFSGKFLTNVDSNFMI